jgi:hypothetical protein
MQATYQRIQKLFYWKGLKTSVESFVRQCTICQQAKHEHCSSPRLLSPLLVPQNSWQDLSINFIEGLPVSNGFSFILVVVDKFTKFAHFYLLKHPFTVVLVASTFLNYVVKLHCLPKTIVSDRDKMFISAFWKALFSSLNVQLQLSSA